MNHRENPPWEKYAISGKKAVVFGWIDAESVGAPSGRDGMPPWVLYDFWQPFVTRL